MRILSVLLLLGLIQYVFTADILKAIAVLTPAPGKTGISGTVTFSGTPGSNVSVTADISGIVDNPNGLHGIHIHAFGDLRGWITATGTLSGPSADVTGAASVGGHWNPENNPNHRCENDASPHHKGDMGNWQATGGRITQTKVFGSFSLTGANSVVGLAVVLHAAQDDCNDIASAGARLAAGVIGIANVGSTDKNLAIASNTYTEAICVPQGTASCTGTCGLGAGVVRLTAGSNVKVEAHIVGITSEKGFHIHTFGDITATDGTSAGGHYNPEGATHGLPGVNNMRHWGDLGSIKTFVGGHGLYNFMPTDGPTLVLSELVGRAVIVHRDLDHGNDPTCDQGTTTGNAGPRQFMCVIGVMNPNTGLPLPNVQTATFDNTWRSTPCFSSTGPAGTSSASSGSPSSGTTGSGTTGSGSPGASPSGGLSSTERTILIVLIVIIVILLIILIILIVLICLKKRSS